MVQSAFSDSPPEAGERKLRSPCCRQESRGIFSFHRKNSPETVSFSCFWKLKVLK